MGIFWITVTANGIKEMEKYQDVPEQSNIRV
jgi:hypothetical protein